MEVINESWCHPITALDRVDNYYMLSAIVSSISFMVWLIMILMTIGGITWIIAINKGNVKIRDDKRGIWMIFDGKNWIDE